MNANADSHRSFGHRLSLPELRTRIEKKHRQITTSPAPIGLVPLHIACHSSACGNGLHCLDYLSTGRAGATDRGGRTSPGQCRACLEAVATIPDRPAKTIDAVVELMNQQRKELIREHYWTAPMDLWAYNQAYRLGRIALHAKAYQVLSTRIGPAQPYRERRQTPWNEDIIAYAQHAVAACCRQCVSYWHSIPTGRALEKGQLAYLVSLVTMYLDLRLPGLPDEPSSPANIRAAEIPTPGDPFDLRNALANLMSNGVSPAGMLVPRDQFKLLQTDVFVNQAGGHLEFRPVAEHLDMGVEPHAGTG